MLHILFCAAVPCLMQHICWHDYLLKCFPTAFIAFTRRKFGIFQHHGLYIECKYLYIHVHMRESVYYVSYTGSCQNLCRCNQLCNFYKIVNTPFLRSTNFINLLLKLLKKLTFCMIDLVREHYFTISFKDLFEQEKLLQFRTIVLLTRHTNE